MNKHDEETRIPKVWILSTKEAVGKFRVAGSQLRDGQVALDDLPAGSYNSLVSRGARGGDAGA